MKTDSAYLPKKTAFIVAVLISAALLAGCTPSSDALNSITQPSCLTAIPTGRAVLGSEAHFAGMKYLSKKEFVADFTFHDIKNSREKRLRKLLDRHKNLCIVAWKGNFNNLGTKKIAVLSGNKKGSVFGVAVTVVSASGRKLLFIMLSSRFNFGFSKIFPHVFDAPILR